MKQNYTKKFIKTIMKKALKEPKPKDINQVNRCLLDFFGVTFAGAKVSRSNMIKLDKLICEKGNFSPIGLNSKISLNNACLMNGMNSHVAELDDGSRFGAIHPGAVIFSSLLPMAQKYKVKKFEFIKGVLIGYEVAIRLSKAIQPSHYKRGFHPTATCGCIGAAAGIAIMLKYNLREIEDTIGAATVSAHGTLNVVEKNSELKPYNVGRASQLAAQSAIIGKLGLTPPTDFLFGKSGFLKMSSDNCKLKDLFIDTKKNFLIHNIYFKPYASCRHAHAPIEAALRILKKNLFSINQIERVVITTYKGLKGRHDLKKINSIFSAKMSIPFCVAIAINTGKVDLNSFTQQSILKKKNQILLKKIFFKESNKYHNYLPFKRPASIKIKLLHGNSYFEEVYYSKGEPENPLSNVELKEKYKKLSKFGGVSDQLADHLMDTIWHKSKNLNTLFFLIKKINKSIDVK